MESYREYLVRKVKETGKEGNPNAQNIFSQCLYFYDKEHPIKPTVTPDMILDCSPHIFGVEAITDFNDCEHVSEPETPSSHSMNIH